MGTIHVNSSNIYNFNYNGELIQLKQIFKGLARILGPEITIIVVNKENNAVEPHAILY